MKQIGAYLAKTHLSHILDEVSQGLSYSITRKGVPVALLIPYHATEKADAVAAVKALRQLRKGITWGKGMSTREALKEGRR